MSNPAPPYPYSVEERAKAAYEQFRKRVSPEIAPAWDDAPPYVRGLVSHILENQKNLP